MRTLFTIKKPRPSGMASIPAIVFLMTAVFFVLSQAITMVGNKAVDGQLVSDSVHALYLAESGVEHSWGRLTTAFEQNQNPQTVCNNIATSGTFQLGSGQFQFQTPSVAPTRDLCTVRVVGIVGSARRVIEAAADITRVRGVQEANLVRWHEVLSDE